MANGLVQSPRQIFLASVLKLELAEKRSLDAASRGLQIILMPWLGGVVDRRGNVRLLVVSWAIVSLATVFFLLVTPEARWWIVAAYGCWAAYAAAWFAWTQLAYSLSILAGGQLFDWVSESGRLSWFGVGETSPFRLLFIAGGMLMVAGIGLAARVPEPENNGGRR